jgi:hypothetical protein
MNSDIATYVAQGNDWQKKALKSLRTAVLTAIPEAQESFAYGKPHYSVDGAFVAALHLSKTKVSLLILNAQSLAAEKGFLRSLGGGERKVVDVSEGQEVDAKRVVAALRAVRQMA